MEQSRKLLKLNSIVVLIFAAVSVLKLVIGFCFGEFDAAGLPEGSTENLVLIAKFVFAGISVLFLAPQFYVGIKGLLIAKNPKPAKAHIIWANILFVIAFLGVVLPILEMTSKGGSSDEISALLMTLVEVLVYYDFIKSAKDVAAKI